MGQCCIGAAKSGVNLDVTSAVPVGSMYSCRKVGGSLAFSWMAK